jgi:hypothetical protein
LLLVEVAVQVMTANARAYESRVKRLLDAERSFNEDVLG